MRAFTRNGHDWTGRYGPIIAAAQSLAVPAVIDGEVIVQDEQGRSDFAALPGAIEGAPERLIFIAFDLLVLAGEDLRSEPLRDRRARLRELVGDHDPRWPILFSAEIPAGGEQAFSAACGMELEGIVSKKAGGRYRSGRTTSWLKTKCFQEGEFVVVGAEHQPGSPAYALLARETGEGFRYAGSAFVTLGGAERDRFWSEVERLGRSSPALPMAKRARARWVEPRLRLRAQYLHGAEKLRHATVRERCEAGRGGEALKKS